MIAEVIEKGDATFTIKYTAVSGQEALIMSMMSTTNEKGISLSATGEYVHVGAMLVPVLSSLKKAF